ncbi:replicative DNA helicase [Candidatus Karelsulcia muelleri]|uniref:Replicative DNA helicase n=1 Tax=Candidatus Karelsulcia muelleri PSPU TaxID=1189303 RepID=A0AAD1AYW5_9FLAO|nr:replicative DNA helicase [Candidatus Karelsulcia muelleri]NJJ98626.1 replicative DNA helicase [Candidatus Karelsulcia muelleri]BAO66284.1 replicative DNA helicase [Candidatus Karelsulcia muelleri PSPU]
MVKSPPQAIDLEEAVLGALMIDKKVFSSIIDIITPEIFYKNENREIFKVIQKLFNYSKPIDLYTVSNQLKKEGKINFIGGDYYLIKLTQKVISSAHIKYHANIIRQKFILRRLIEISYFIIKNSYKETTDVFDILNYAESQLFNISNNNFKRNYENAKDLIDRAISNIKKLQLNNGLSGIPSGFKTIDNITGGWQKSDLIIIAARPGMGKTSFALSMTRNIVIKYNIPTMIFSLEMSSIQLITRLIYSETEISSEKFRKSILSDFEWNKIFIKIKKLKNSPLFIDDTPSLSVFDLRAKCRRMVSQHKIGIIIIDYLQLMTVSNKPINREQEISLISRNLKSIAKELNIPIIAISQLSRAVEIRGGYKRPLLSDLRESGAIEQDADIVSFIYRPDYYGFHYWDNDESTPCKGEAEFIIAKNRNGGLYNLKLNFISNSVKFTEKF